MTEAEIHLQNPAKLFRRTRPPLKKHRNSDKIAASGRQTLIAMHQPG